LWQTSHDEAAEGELSMSMIYGVEKIIKESVAEYMKLNPTKNILCDEKAIVDIGVKIAKILREIDGSSDL